MKPRHVHKGWRRGPSRAVRRSAMTRNATGASSLEDSGAAHDDRYPLPSCTEEKGRSTSSPAIPRGNCEEVLEELSQQLCSNHGNSLQLYHRNVDKHGICWNAIIGITRKSLCLQSWICLKFQIWRNLVIGITRKFQNLGVTLKSWRLPSSFVVLLNGT